MFLDGEVPFKVRLSGDYPVDLYFLIDFSWSMRPYVENLYQTAASIANEITEITTHYMIGLGGFVEKPMLPFSSELANKVRY